MVELKLIVRSEFERIRQAKIDRYKKLELLGDMHRANTLSMVKRAGSGHLGSSFSCLDIVTYLYYEEMNITALGIAHPDRDIYFSSKGHDVPGFYSVLYSLGILPEEQYLRLRRLGGVHGHPEMGVPGIEANSGSLGMGISKAKGMAHAKAIAGRKGRVFVMTGDGELQEGQNYEAFQTAVQQNITNLIVIVDHNKLQSDKQITEITNLGNMEAKFGAFGWHVLRCDGHDYRALEQTIEKAKALTDKPRIIIADTIKGRGVSFMEHPQALADNKGLYRWHSGAPDDESFTKGYAEIAGRIDKTAADLRLDPVQYELVALHGDGPSGVSKEYVAEAYGQTLVELGKTRKDLVVLDADLAADCRVRAFELQYPERFIEDGIAEQDMVSMAGGLALQGFLPVVNSFACFLASRANEQIYTNTCEKTKIIYACHYAGLLPAGPGLSHQSVRDISLFGALPDFTIVQPGNALEAKLLTEYCVTTAHENCMIRLIIGPSPRLVELPAGYKLAVGQGSVLADGKD
ncbi:MAG TPA: 1-deoxy-D-xylulose-5-phosphate synthase N-terminal domain-containing protein, partial [Oligoflexia bacterium]|nr:1-deoxy-D-xylulose-5-phosphate synthase N-terminal domain-containing protein [Oligoflexia bacterium]